MIHRSIAALALSAFTLVAGPATAHVAVASGPGTANKSQEVVFGVGHGCEGIDTYAVRVDIPASVTSVRAMTSDFGAVTFEKNDAGVVTAVTWQKDPADLLDGDSAYYKLVLRIRVPDQPFTRLFFPTHQTCRTRDGMETVVDWVGEVDHEAEGGPEPAPALLIVPERRSGWNRFTVPAAVENLADFFGDAEIVWKGDSAFSANPVTTELITGTPGVTPLMSLAAGDEVWVRY